MKAPVGEGELSSCGPSLPHTLLNLHAVSAQQVQTEAFLLKASESTERCRAQACGEECLATHALTSSQETGLLSTQISISVLPLLNMYHLS